jgi:hypothetical protein
MPTALQGDRCRFSFSFARLDTGVAATPPVVQVLHRTPDGVETMYTLEDDPDVVIVDSAGNLHADIRLLTPLTHYFRAVGSGDPMLEKSIEESQAVAESAFADPLPQS